MSNVAEGRGGPDDKTVMGASDFDIADLAEMEYLERLVAGYG